MLQKNLMGVMYSTSITLIFLISLFLATSFSLSQEIICNDEIDNDSNGFVDCGLLGGPPDSNCVAIGSCGDTGGEICGDLVDNDGINGTDCADSSCDGVALPSGNICEPSGETMCSDGFDNDFNGFTDCGGVGVDPDPNCEALGLCVDGGPEETIVYGPEEFNGSFINPVSTDNFLIDDTSGEFTLKIQHGLVFEPKDCSLEPDRRSKRKCRIWNWINALQAKFSKAFKVEIMLNGETVVEKGVITKDVDYHEVPIDALDGNDLEVKVFGFPVSFVELTILREGNEPCFKFTNTVAEDLSGVDWFDACVDAEGTDVRVTLRDTNDNIVYQGTGTKVGIWNYDELTSTDHIGNQFTIFNHDRLITLDTGDFLRISGKNTNNSGCGGDLGNGYVIMIYEGFPSTYYQEQKLLVAPYQRTVFPAPRVFGNWTPEGEISWNSGNDMSSCHPVISTPPPSLIPFQGSFTVEVF